MSRRYRERANARPWEQGEAPEPEEKTAWNCPHCYPRLCHCDWCKDEPILPTEPTRCPNTGELFGE